MNPSFTAQDTIKFWNGKSWAEVNTSFEKNTDTVSATLPVSSLTGTEIAVGTSGVNLIVGILRNGIFINFIITALIVFVIVMIGVVILKWRKRKV